MANEVLRLGSTQTVRVVRKTAEELEVEATWSSATEPAPLHLHPAQDEHFEVRAGRLATVVAGEKRSLAAGDQLEIPAGTPHQMWNEVDEPARRVVADPAGGPHGGVVSAGQPLPDWRHTGRPAARSRDRAARVRGRLPTRRPGAAVNVRRLLPALLAVGLLSPTPAAASLRFRDGYGLQVTSVKRLDPRLYALTLKTAALPGPASVRILLPPGYGSRRHRHRRYPVFYLLHGTSGGASDWTVLGRAEQVIGNRPVITVMPDIALKDDGGGWCTDWPNGAERWETFHIGQLLPWVDANLRTLRQRAKRAIAGLSQGGFCSLSYAARHPDLFGIALGYSGAPDIWYDPDARVGARAIINATEVGLDHVPPDTFFGDPITDGINWAAHDPATLAENLRATRMYMYWGSGQPGPLDSSASPSASGIEALVARDNSDFEGRLNSLHIPAYFDYYGAGTHSWPYWTRDLQWSISTIMSDFRHPGPAGPAAYMSADDQYTFYGWMVDMHRTAREFSTFSGASPAGFKLAGSGSASVTTPPIYRSGKRYSLTLFGSRVPQQSETLTAPRNRRLQIDVPLGPPNPFQQYTLQAAVAGTAVYTTTVVIRPTAR